MTEPVSCPLFIDDQRLRVSERVEMANDVDEGSITGGSGIGDNDSVMRLVFASGASKSDFYHVYQVLVDGYIMHYPTRPVNGVLTIICQKLTMPL